MKMISDAPYNKWGMYLFQEGNLDVLPDGMLLWPDKLEADTFSAHAGIITPSVRKVKGVPTVASYEVNAEAWEAWQAYLREEPEPVPEPQPTAEQLLDVLLGEEVSADE